MFFAGDHGPSHVGKRSKTGACCRWPAGAGHRGLREPDSGNTDITSTAT
jgi:hypothetical protein